MLYEIVVCKLSLSVNPEAECNLTFAHSRPDIYQIYTQYGDSKGNWESFITFSLGYDKFLAFVLHSAFSTELYVVELHTFSFVFIKSLEDIFHNLHLLQASIQMTIPVLQRIQTVYRLYLKPAFPRVLYISTRLAMHDMWSKYRSFPSLHQRQVKCRVMTLFLMWS